jgi:hypothetical protein
MAASGDREQRAGMKQRPETHADLDEERDQPREVAPGDARALI